MRSDLEQGYTAMTTVINLANSFAAFVTIFFLASSIAFGWPSPTFHAQVWADPAQAATVAAAVFLVWMGIGLFTRLGRVRRQPPQTLTHEEAFMLLTPFAAPAVSGVLIVLAFCIGRPATFLPGEWYWLSIVTLGVLSITLMTQVIRIQKRIEVAPA